LTPDDLFTNGFSDTNGLWRNLETNHYILPGGNITLNFYDLRSPEQMALPPSYQSNRESIYTLMRGDFPKSMGYNQITPRDAAALLKGIYDGKVINADISRRCLNLLKRNLLNDRIPAGLPPGTVVAHKTGSTEQEVHDCGVVFTPNGDFVLCVLTKGAKKDYIGGRDFIRKMAGLCYDYQTGNLKLPYRIR
jgi:hypothetical protein